MTAALEQAQLGRMLDELKKDAASFRQEAQSLADLAGELSRSGGRGDLRRSIEKFQGGIAELVTNLLGLGRSAERAITSAELNDATALDNNADLALRDSETLAEMSREGAVNALAAALIKTSGGDITHQGDLIPALHAAENVVEAIADYVLTRQRGPLS